MAPVGAVAGASLRDVVIRPGSLIFPADGTVAGCSENDETDGCRSRDERHDGPPKRRVEEGGCNYCGVHTG